MGTATKGQWRERYYKENFCISVDEFLLRQIEKDAAFLKELVGRLEEGEVKQQLIGAVEELTLHAAQASGRLADFDLAALHMPEDVEAKIPDARDEEVKRRYLSGSVPGASIEELRTASGLGPTLKRRKKREHAEES